MSLQNSRRYERLNFLLPFLTIRTRLFSLDLGLEATCSRSKQIYASSGEGGLRLETLKGKSFRTELLVREKKKFDKKDIFRNKRISINNFISNRSSTNSILSGIVAKISRLFVILFLNDLNK